MDQSRSEIGEGSSIRQDLTVAVKVAYANIAIFFYQRHKKAAVWRENGG
ncbi:hypothetical protein [Kordiimonas lipolytica]|nr:hypothetical protein [Kordiimonas lipolytica]